MLKEANTELLSLLTTIIPLIADLSEREKASIACGGWRSSELGWEALTLIRGLAGSPPMSLAVVAPRGPKEKSGSPGQTESCVSVTVPEPTRINKPVLFQIKHTVFPVLLVPRIGSGRLSLTPLAHLITYPLTRSGPPNTSAVKGDLGMDIVPGAPVALSFTTSRLGVRSGIEVIVNLEEAPPKFKFGTVSAAPLPFVPSPPPTPAPPTDMKEALLKSPEPTKKPLQTDTLPVKSFALFMIDFPVPDCMKMPNASALALALLVILVILVILPLKV